ncbi:MAG: hypothetical protein E6J26_09545 [Chloroflexi bacterium]|nr:MAG: hypothetical protein E6J26_09545 [Chloroflexota bacterium]
MKGVLKSCTQFPLLVSGFAFALRLWRIDAQSLRGDEAFDVMFASQRLGDVVYQALYGQTYPPLDHVLDHFWQLVAGRSELSARFIALGAGVLIVPLVYQLGRLLFGEAVARMAMLLIALHPFLLWHAQDGRMYMLLCTLAAASALSALRLWRGTAQPDPSQPRSRRRDWLLYIGVTSLSLLNHYFAYFAVFALNVVALYLWRRRRWTLRFAMLWFGANAWVGALAALWLVPAWPHLAGHSEPWIVPVTPLDILSRALFTYSVGTTLAWSVALPLLLLFVFLLAAGLFGGHEQPEAPGARAVLALATFVPLAAVYAGSLWRPMYDAKFLIFVVPPYMLLIARGMAVLGVWPATRRLQPLAVAVVCAGMAFSIGNYEFDPQYAKSPPWREAAHVILSQAETGDLLVYNFPDPALPYQVDGALPVLLLPGQAPSDAAAAKPLPGESAERELASLNEQYKRIWFVPQPASNWDHTGAVSRWLSRHAAHDFSHAVGSLTVERYLTARTYRQRWVPLDAQFADGISLRAYNIRPADEVIHVTLFWQTDAPVFQDYTVFLHLLDSAGLLRAQQDNPPVRGTYPTSEWIPGQIVIDRYDIITPSDLKAGHYRFEVGLYNACGVRVRVGDDDKVIFGDELK